MALAVIACHHADAQGTASTLPPAPVVHGPLQVVVAYPADGATIAFGDSTFLFGTVGDGNARLTVAGQSVDVAPNGAWLAWVALPDDSLVTVPLVARLGGDSSAATVHIVRAGWVRTRGAWVDRQSLAPEGDVVMPAGEALPLTVRAAPGASVRLILPGGGALRFAADSLPDPVPAGIRAFDHDDRNLQRPVSGDRYVATLRGVLDPRSAARILPTPGARVRSRAILEVARGGDTTRTPWPLAVTRLARPPLAVVLGEGSPGPGNAGTAAPVTGRELPAGTYAWFLPQGTRTRADMRIGDQVRLRLAADAIAWVPDSAVHPAAASDDARRAVMGSPVLVADPASTRLRIPLTRPVPLSVDETDRGLAITLYDAVSDADWTRYGAGQRFVQLLTWRQATDDRVVLTVHFDRPLWGWRVRVDHSDLVFDFRPPPAIDPSEPLRGRRIVIDPGHPPGGACGPTGLCEPEVNLDIANLVRDALRAGGATVVMTRNGPGDVGLSARVALADSVDAELLVSIHNNALPDGVNPFSNNGTSTSSIIRWRCRLRGPCRIVSWRISGCAISAWPAATSR